MSWKILSENFHSWNWVDSKILEFSALFKIKSWNFLQKKFQNFHDKLGFLEFSGPTIFLLAIFCLEIFCPGILFHGKYMDSRHCVLAKMMEKYGKRDYFFVMDADSIAFDLNRYITEYQDSYWILRET